jgi:hypothetical protein
MVREQEPVFRFGPNPTDFGPESPQSLQSRSTHLEPGEPVVLPKHIDQLPKPDATRGSLLVPIDTDLYPTYTLVLTALYEKSTVAGIVNPPKIDGYWITRSDPSTTEELGTMARLNLPRVSVLDHDPRAPGENDHDCHSKDWKKDKPQDKIFNIDFPSTGVQGYLFRCKRNRFKLKIRSPTDPTRLVTCSYIKHIGDRNYTQLFYSDAAGATLVHTLPC